MAAMDDDALFANLREKLFTAVVGDVLDKLGHRRQFLPQAVAPLRADMKIVGRAMPVLEADVFDEASVTTRGLLGARPFGLMLEALDDLKPHEVYIATGASFRYALWGELMSTRATRLRAAGAVLNGFVRDAAGIEALNFPPSAAAFMRRTKVRAARSSTSAPRSRSRGFASRRATSSLATAKGC